MPPTQEPTEYQFLEDLSKTLVQTGLYITQYLYQILMVDPLA